MVGGGGGSTFNFKYIHCTICVEVSLLNVNGAMQVLTPSTFSRLTSTQIVQCMYLKLNVRPQTAPDPNIISTPTDFRSFIALRTI